MRDKLEKIKELLNEGFPILEGALVSGTRYDQESSKDDNKEVEDEKSFEEDRLDLEEILSQSTNFKKNYVKKVVDTVNKLIDGTADIEDLTKAVKGKRKKRCK